MSALPEDFVQEMQQTIDGEIRTDFTTRLLYSTDASIYQMEPLGVVFPSHLDDLQAIVELAARHKVPLLARGAGSSLAGQAIGPALIIDCSRHLTRLIEINPEERTTTVEPGLVLNTLNRAAAAHGLTFGPDPASAERATIGGSIANNASGSHSILYGMTADHLLAAEVVLADGSLATFASVSLDEAQRRAESSANALEAALYRLALTIRQHYAETIRNRFPRVWRRACGYNLNYLMPWSPTAPPLWEQVSAQWLPEGHPPAPLPYPPVHPGEINLAPLIAGSEGTLAIIRRAKLRLVPKPKHTLLGILAFDSVAEACDFVPEVLSHHPSGVELIPGSLIQLARSVPAYARQVGFVNGNPQALLVVEFAGDEPALLQNRAIQLKHTGEQMWHREVNLLLNPAEQQQIWNVRKVSLGLAQSRPGEDKYISFIEDLSVPVERLGEFVRGIERIFQEHGLQAEIYAHASAGCLHIRPALNLKTSEGVRKLRTIAQQAVEWTLHFGGAISGEHGVGLARSEWIESAFGSEIVALFRAVKQAADPQGLLNPGKILDSQPMDVNLRFGPDYRAQGWHPVLDFSTQGGLEGAIEMCNGAGVCRKDDGVMCPSFQATREEMHSTRGRANLLRAMISGKFSTQRLAESSVHQALDLCLACKGCKAECPSSVDIAKLKVEFYHQYYQRHRRRLRDNLFAYIGSMAPLGSLLAPLVNPLLEWSWVRNLGERVLGIAAERPFPKFAAWHLLNRRSNLPHPTQPNLLLLSDVFSHYFYPEIEQAALRVLELAGFCVHLIPVLGAGRTLISKGFLDAAKRHAHRLVSHSQALDPQGQLPILGIEPSEIYTLREEFLDLFPGDERVRALAKRAWMLDEFLIRPHPDGVKPIDRLTHLRVAQPNGKTVLLHGHCHQKARPPAEDGYPVGVEATVSMLRSAGYTVNVIEAGCCGMAGAFGYEAEHYDLSMRIGEMALFPAVRAATEEVLLAAAGASCRAQITDGTGRTAIHPILLLEQALR